MRRRQIEVVLNDNQFWRRLATALLIAGLLLLVGCGGLGAGSSPTTTAAAVSVTNASLSFGTVAIGSSTTLADTISNNTSSSVTIGSIAGLGSGFQVTGVTLPLVLTAGQSAAFKVEFQPASAGSPSVSISFEDQNGQMLVSLSASASAVAAGALSLSPTQLSFGSVAVGSSQPSTVTLSNSGNLDLSITQATLSGAGFTMSNLASLPLTLHAGDTTSATITFAPTGSGTFSGNVTFTTTSNEANGTVVLNLSGTGGIVSQGTLSPSPSSLPFGNVQVGSNSSLSETLTNSSGSAITISQANLSGASFSVSGLTLPLTLTANGSVTFTATFAPTGAGAASGGLSVVSNASNSPLNIALSGTGTAAGQLAISPSSLSFGSVVVGSSSSLKGSLTASGASVTVTTDSLGTGEFVLSGISLPATISTGQSAPFTVTFTPQSSGAASASLSFASNASNSPAPESITGTGTAPTQHTVDLAWTASADVVGYNVYRSTVSGTQYTMINSSLDSSTAYNDSTVVSGQTYYYVVTAVNASSQESGYSNQVQAVIPNP
jgi:HYDIN/CFA65/VesB family protein/ASPM-SPD-2-Hydin domain-containing protein